MPNRFINPEKAAHNIALAYCNAYLTRFENTDTALLGAIGTLEQSEHAAKMAQLYANVFDAAFEELEKENQLE